jgi:hypothetical protein
LLEQITSAVAARSVARGNRWILRFAANDPVAALGTKNLVVGCLEAAGETVLGFRLDPPDLASAYCNLTDETIAAPGKPVPRRGAGSRAKDHGLGQSAGVE